MGGNIRRSFRSSVAPATPKPGSLIDWVEWRADEFMGAFLVPADRLARVLPKHASALDLPFRWRGPRRMAVPFPSSISIRARARSACWSMIWPKPSA